MDEGGVMLCTIFEDLLDRAKMGGFGVGLVIEKCLTFISELHM